MEKNIKDYLHLYLGCEVEWKHYAGEYSSGTYNTNYFSSGILRELSMQNGSAKPILRPLSDMTEEEITEIAADIFSVTPHLIEYSLDEIKYFIINNEMIVVGAAEDEYEAPPSIGGYELSPATFFYLTKFLLSKHFDLFGLIESGLAIDKNKLTNDGK